MADTTGQSQSPRCGRSKWLIQVAEAAWGPSSFLLPLPHCWHDSEDLDSSPSWLLCDFRLLIWP